MCPTSSAWESDKTLLGRYSLSARDVRRWSHGPATPSLLSLVPTLGQASGPLPTLHLAMALSCGPRKDLPEQAAVL